MRNADRIRLQHMLEAAKEAQLFAFGKSRVQLGSERMLALSLVRLLEIVGEAASGLSHECREKYPHIPWRDIVAMRNRLIHAYFDINLDIVWRTVTEELPELCRDLEEVLASET